MRKDNIIFVTAIMSISTAAFLYFILIYNTDYPEQQATASAQTDMQVDIPVPDNEKKDLFAPLIPHVPVKDNALDAFVNSDNNHDRMTNAPDCIVYEEDFPAVINILKDTSETDTIRNLAAKLLINSNYKQVRSEILDVLAETDQSLRYRAYCVQHLWTLYNTDRDAYKNIIDDIHRIINDPAPEVQREALLFLTRIQDSSCEAIINEWLNAPEHAPVRDIAIRCASELDLEEHLPVIRQSLNNADEKTVIAAIIAVKKWNDATSLPVLEELKDSERQTISKAAWSAIQSISNISSTQIKELPRSELFHKTDSDNEDKKDGENEKH